MKQVKPGIFQKNIRAMIVFFSLLFTAGAEANAATPEVLNLEIVIEANHQTVVPCQINSQNQGNNGINPANNEKNDHAAHHPSGNGPDIQPVPFTEAARGDAIKELNDSKSYLLELLDTLEFQLNSSHSSLNPERK